MAFRVGLSARLRASFALAACAVLAASCARDAVTAPAVAFGYGVVRISPTMLSYGAGAYVRLEIENVGPSVLATGMCPTKLEVQNGNKWDAVSNFDASCDAILVRIDPGTIGPGTLALPNALRTGLYRARYDKFVTVDERTAVNTVAPLRTQYSETFAVTASPAR